MHSFPNSASACDLASSIYLSLGLYFSRIYRFFHQLKQICKRVKLQRVTVVYAVVYSTYQQVGTWPTHILILPRVGTRIVVTIGLEKMSSPNSQHNFVDGSACTNLQRLQERVLNSLIRERWISESILISYFLCFLYVIFMES